MKKRILSMLLASILLFSLTAPAFAASGDSADRLAAVTDKVKKALALDTERYTDFNGQLTEGELAPTWQLTWSGSDGSLEISASESGRILSCYRFDEDDSWDSGSLSLPKSDPAKAKAAADAFLKQVLDSSETVNLDDDSSSSNSLRQTRYYFRGTLLLNGCASPLSYSLTVRASDYAITQFHRDGLETGYIGSTPAAKFQMKQSAVEPLLQGTLSLRLEYVLNEDGKTASLQYLPNSIHSFYVDDASQKLVDLTKLFEELGEDYKNMAADQAAFAPMPTEEADAGAAGYSLTQAEQLGADKLKGTLSKDELDKKARAISQLGLDQYTLASASYQEQELVKGSPIIAARLSYAKRDDGNTIYRWVTLNAKTGELLSVSSSRTWHDDEEDAKKVDENTARKTAEAFLTAQQKSRFAQCGDYTGDPAYAADSRYRYGVWGFEYARKANGYFFPADFFSVSIDAMDGSVSSYSQSWTDKVSFDAASGIVSEEKAVSAYFKTFTVSKGYVAVPQKLDLSDPDFAPLAEMGYRALNSLKLGWQLKASDQHVTGIDAKTGKPVYQTSTESGSVQYSDLANSNAKNAVETLAAYGIGYAGGKFQPGKKLTQLDLAALLASTQGVLIDPDNLKEGEADRVYRTVFNMGALQRNERSDSKTLTRMDVVKILLDASGYGPAAKLQGIYKTSFADQADIPGAMLGYAALAQALKVAQGEKLNPSQTVDRGEAAVMLLALMQRN